MGWPGPSEPSVRAPGQEALPPGPTRFVPATPDFTFRTCQEVNPRPRSTVALRGRNPRPVPATSRRAKSLQTDPRRCRYPSCRLENRTGQGRPGVGPLFSVASRDGPATRRPRGQGLGPHLLECGGRPLTRTGLVRRGPSPTVSGRSHMETVRTICCKLDPMPEQSHRASASSGRELKAPRNSGERSRMTRIGLACSPKTGPVIMQIVQLAETRERLHAKANQP